MYKNTIFLILSPSCLTFQRKAFIYCAAWAFGGHIPRVGGEDAEKGPKKVMQASGFTAQAFSDWWRNEFKVLFLLFLNFLKENKILLDHIKRKKNRTLNFDILVFILNIIFFFFTYNFDIYTH